MLKALASLALLLSSLTGVMAQNVPSNVVSDLAPSGTLRVAINYGNTVLAQKDPASGEPKGVSAALARELAKRLGVPISFVTFDAAGKVFDALKPIDVAHVVRGQYAGYRDEPGVAEGSGTANAPTPAAELPGETAPELEPLLAKPSIELTELTPAPNGPLGWSEEHHDCL